MFSSTSHFLSTPILQMLHMASPFHPHHKCKSWPLCHPLMSYCFTESGSAQKWKYIKTYNYSTRKTGQLCQQQQPSQCVSIPCHDASPTNNASVKSLPRFFGHFCSTWPVWLQLQVEYWTLEH